MNRGRTENSVRNVKIIFLIYILNIVLQFVGRTFFLCFLSVDYLGINGLFTNILSMLNMAELGVGSAMVYALYKPCAEGNILLIKQIMKLYKKVYACIGIFVGIVGVALTPFLPMFINDMPTNLGNIYIYYLLYVLNTAVSYFFTYKRSLIICFQNQYISTITSFLKNVFICLFQIIFLWLTRNYYIYLIIQVIFTITENVVISKIADKEYPYLKEKAELPPQDVKDKIKKNIMAMSFHKIGGVVVNGTDNLIITKIVSLTATGLYSNYAIVITAITSLVTQIFSALTASVGNLLVVEDKKNAYIVFKRMYFINFLIYMFTGVGLILLFNDFICLWLGEKYILSIGVVLCIVVSFVSNGMRRTVLVFKDAAGLFWNDRYKPVFEVLCNLILSIPLTIYLGIAGTFMGTIFTNIFVSGIIEAYVLFKNGFNISVKKYFFQQLKYYCIFASGLCVAGFLCRYIMCNYLLNIILKGIVILLVLIIEIFICFWRTDEFKYVYTLFKAVIAKHKK